MVTRRVHSIQSLLLIAFVIIAFVPVSFLGVKLYQAAWENAWREIDEKHKVLAKNLSAPILIFVRNHQTMLAMIATEINSVATAEQAKNAQLLKHTLSRVNAFQALTLMNTDDMAKIVVQSDGATQFDVATYSNTTTYIDTVMSEEPRLSGAVFSPLDHKPTVLITQPVRGPQGNIIGVLIAELRVSILDDLRKGIEFGKGGHSVIVDATGRVISHPNPEWMANIQNISDGRIIQAMISGETGVTEFFSAWRNEEMVAGYTSVPEIRWGVMVPQPRSEVEDQVYNLLSAQLAWGLGGVALAVMMAMLLARWITSPLQRLARAAQTLLGNNYEGSLPAANDKTPEEIQQLNTVLRDLIGGLQTSREEVNDLNKSLQQRVENATEQLRITNQQLETALDKRDEFVSFARHDLRKPIAVIIDVTETLAQNSSDGSLTPKVLTELLDLINKTTRYMGHIVDDFLSKEAFTDGNITIHKKFDNLNRIVRLIFKSNEEYARRKKIKLTLLLDQTIHPIELDEARISQVCQNLIDNAVKFCDAGDEVTVSTKQLENAVEVRIADTGPGLTQEDLTQVFNKNVKLSNKPTGGEISTGTGLVICKQVIELHGGQIGVENNPERGCTFWFQLH